MSVLTDKLTRAEEVVRKRADRTHQTFSHDAVDKETLRWSRASRRAAQWLAWKIAQPGCAKAKAPAWCMAWEGNVEEWREVNQRPPALVFPSDLRDIARHVGWHERKRAAAAAQGELATRLQRAARAARPMARPRVVKVAPAGVVFSTDAEAQAAAVLAIKAGDAPRDQVLTIAGADGFRVVVTGSAIDRDIVRLALRPQGATRRDFAACSPTQRPWTERLKRAATRHGLVYAATMAQGRTTYYLTP